MSQTFNLFILEDDDRVFDEYEPLIEEFSKSNNIMIKTHREKNVDKALDALKNNWYDGAIIDIRLSPDEGRDGNEIIREIRDNLRFPIRVYTGFDDIDDDLRQENEFYKVYKRTSKRFNEIILDLINIYRTGITNILGKKGTVEEYLKNVFWNHLAGSFNNWIDEAKSNSNIEKVLLRYTLSHLQEYLDKDVSGDYDEYHPSEVYIRGPINENIHTGLILQKKDTNELHIVLTPSCDLAQRKAKKIVLSPIEKKDMQYVKDLKDKMAHAPDNEIKKQAEQALRGLLSNNHSLKYHCLPEVNGVGGFINFQKITSFTEKEINDNFLPIATVTDKFCKDIIARFSGYYARQGQPNFDTAKIYDLMYK